jgi:hypothetical protein
MWLCGDSEEACDKLRLTRCITACQSFHLPFPHVAEATGISVRIVREIRNRYVDKLKSEVKFETPRVLGIDGVCTAGKLCIILTDIEESLMIDLLEGANKDVIESGLKGLPDPSNIHMRISSRKRAERKRLPVFPSNGSSARLLTELCLLFESLFSPVSS